MSNAEENRDKIRISGLEVLETITPVLEMLDGFKALCAEHGYSAQSQEEMAVAMFKNIMVGNNNNNNTQ